MKIYAQFFVGDREGVGTDSVTEIDGRLGLAEACAAAEERRAQIKEHLSLPYTGYELRRRLDGARPFGHYLVIYRSWEV